MKIKLIKLKYNLSIKDNSHFSSIFNLSNNYPLCMTPSI